MASDDLRTYEPTVIPDTPFPDQVIEGVSSDAQGKDGVYSPKIVKEQPFPTKKIAHELIGSVLNTRSKKILQEFQFTEHGAIQVGKYTNGVNGDIRISPAGITARNQSGLTTLAIDGDTGDAVFAGTLEAGTLIGGDGQVTIDNPGDGGRVMVNDGTYNRVLLGFHQGGF